MRERERENGCLLRALKWKRETGTKLLVGRSFGLTSVTCLLPGTLLLLLLDFAPWLWLAGGAPDKWPARIYFAEVNNALAVAICVHLKWHLRERESNSGQLTQAQGRQLKLLGKKYWPAARRRQSRVARVRPIITGA